MKTEEVIKRLTEAGYKIREISDNFIAIVQENSIILERYTSSRRDWSIRGATYKEYLKIAEALNGTVEIISTVVDTK